jgi:hypothetical protein
MGDRDKRLESVSVVDVEALLEMQMETVVVGEMLGVTLGLEEMLVEKDVSAEAVGERVALGERDREGEGVAEVLREGLLVMLGEVEPLRVMRAVGEKTGVEEGVMVPPPPPPPTRVGLPVTEGPTLRVPLAHLEVLGVLVAQALLLPEAQGLGVSDGTGEEEAEPVALTV